MRIGERAAFMHALRVGKSASIMCGAGPVKRHEKPSCSRREGYAGEMHSAQRDCGSKLCERVYVCTGVNENGNERDRQGGGGRRSYRTAGCSTRREADAGLKLQQATCGGSHQSLHAAAAITASVAHKACELRPGPAPQCVRACMHELAAGHLPRPAGVAGAACRGAPLSHAPTHAPHACMHERPSAGWGTLSRLRHAMAPAWKTTALSSLSTFAGHGCSACCSLNA